MALTAPSPAATRASGGGLTSPRLLVAVFAVTQTVGYGVLFYAFSVLLAPIAADLHTSAATVTGALTVAVIVAAAAAIPVGRWLDRHGGRLLMTSGSILGVAAVLAWSQVHTVAQLYAVFAVMGLASAMMLYEAAFSVIVATVGPTRRNNALVAVTIVAGFASSIFFPLTGLLLEHHGWRTTLIILAVLLAALTIPGHALAVPARHHHHHNDARHTGRSGVGVGQALRERTFWLLSIGFVAHAAAVSAVGVHLVGLLRSAGHPTAVAATLSGLLGVLSVTGRLTTTGLARRHSIVAITAIVFAVQAVGVAALPALGHTLTGAAACVAAFGLGFGVATIARPAILADRYGTARYATIAATMTAPITLAKAAAPLAAAAVSSTTFAIAASTACLLAATALAITSVRWRVRYGG
ncbi:MAG TPA: MFS transporter [Micromonosporaceae bacterium]